MQITKLSLPRNFSCYPISPALLDFPNSAARLAPAPCTTLVRRPAGSPCRPPCARSSRADGTGRPGSRCLLRACGAPPRPAGADSPATAVQGQRDRETRGVSRAECESSRGGERDRAREKIGREGKRKGLLRWAVLGFVGEKPLGQ